MYNLFPSMESGEEPQQALKAKEQDELAVANVFEDCKEQQSQQVPGLGISSVSQLLQEHGADGQEAPVGEAQQDKQDAQVQGHQLKSDGQRNQEVPDEFHGGSEPLDEQMEWEAEYPGDAVLPVKQHLPVLPESLA